jgi:hypothetical protein
VKKLTSSGMDSAIWLLFLIGLPLFFLWKLFRSGPTTSPNLEALPPEQLLLKKLMAEGVSPRTAKFWTAVSKFETGNFTSALFLKHNNFWGMKFPVKRETTALHSVPPKGFASYRSRVDAVRDLLLYMREFNYPNDFTSAEELVSFMKKKGYFEEPLQFYLAGVKKYL